MKHPKRIDSSVRSGAMRFINTQHPELTIDNTHQHVCALMVEAYSAGFESARKQANRKYPPLEDSIAYHC